MVPPPTETPAARWVLSGISLVVVGLLLAPAITGRDSFPISTQPMYAAARPAVETFVTARGVGPTPDSFIELTMHEIADTDDPLVARQRTQAAARGGLIALDDLCRAIVVGVSAERRVSAVEVIEVRVDVADFARTSTSAPRVLTRCERP